MPEDKNKSLALTALTVVPALAVVAVVVSSYAAQAPDVMAARIYGGPPGIDGTLAWRIVVTLRDRGYYEPLSNIPIEIEMNGQVLEGVTDDEGAWEARIPLGDYPSDKADVQVRRRDSKVVLWSGPVEIRPSAWQQSLKRVHPQLPGRRKGALTVDLYLSRGTLAASFPERILIRVTNKEDPVPEAQLSASGDGVEVIIAPGNTDREGRSELTVHPLFQTPTLAVEASAPSGESGSFESVLPTRTGALWIDPDKLVDGTLFIASPVGHRRAYVTLFNERTRLAGMRVALSPDGTGGATGSMTLPPLPQGLSWALVSTDPQGTGGEKDLYGWPLVQRGEDTPMDSARVSTPLLADGMPGALALSKARAHAGRLRASLILAVAAFIVVGLLWSRARHAKGELDRVLASHADVEEAVARALLGGTRFWLKMLVAAFLVGLGFGVLSLLIWMDGI